MSIINFKGRGYTFSKFCRLEDAFTSEVTSFKWIDTNTILLHDIEISLIDSKVQITKFGKSIDASELCTWFGRIFFSLIEIINKVKPKLLIFDGSINGVGHVFSGMKRNLYFQKELKSIGYVFDDSSEMNYYVYRRGEGMTTFKEFLLLEAITFHEISFGCNSEMNDCEIKYSKESEAFYTFFKAPNDDFYCVKLIEDVGVFGFAVSTKFSLDMVDYSDAAFSSTNPFNIFSYVLFILKKLIEHHPVKNIIFDGQRPELYRMYKVMVKNRNLNNLIQSETGYRYLDEFDKNFVYSKINEPEFQDEESDDIF